MPEIPLTSEFHEWGVLHLKRFIPSHLIRTAREDLVNELTRVRIRVDGKWNSKQFEGLPTLQIPAKIAQKLAHQPSFDKLMTHDLAQYMDQLAGVRLSATRSAVLVTPPQNLTVSLPTLGWHVDAAPPADGKIPGVQAFILLSDLSLGGGATAVLAGSHRAHPLGKAQPGLLHKLREDRFFGDLFNEKAEGREKFRHAHPFHDIPLKVIEMCGHAGDVYLMDMRCLHTASVNASRHPRLVITARHLNS